jgi:GNAT superfamily N-acetyltransferase
MSVEVVELASGDDAELSRFLDSLGQRSGSVLGYHHPFYRDMLEHIGVGRPLYLGARISGRLIGYLPAFVKRTPDGSALCSLPFFGPNAGVLCAPEDAAEVHTALLQRLLRVGAQLNGLSCSVYTPFLFQDFAFYDAAFADATVVTRSTQYLDLSSIQWSKEIQYDLRKAHRSSIQVSTETTRERLVEFYDIYRQNCEDNGIPPKPWECIEFLADEKLQGKYAQFYFAILDHQLISGLLVLSSPTTASYYVPCTLKDHRSHQPGTLLIARAIEDARARGLKYWNWESSANRSGVLHFKKKWGSIEQEYRIYVKALPPEERLRQLGRERIAAMFPYFFVTPFDKL